MPTLFVLKTSHTKATNAASPLFTWICSAVSVFQPHNHHILAETAPRSDIKFESQTAARSIRSCSRKGVHLQASLKVNIVTNISQIRRTDNKHRVYHELRLLPSTWSWKWASKLYLAVRGWRPVSVVVDVSVQGCVSQVSHRPLWVIVFVSDINSTSITFNVGWRFCCKRNHIVCHLLICQQRMGSPLLSLQRQTYTNRVRTPITASGRVSEHTTNLQMEGEVWHFPCMAAALAGTVCRNARHSSPDTCERSASCRERGGGRAQFRSPQANALTDCTPLGCEVQPECEHTFRCFAQQDGHHCNQDISTPPILPWRNTQPWWHNNWQYSETQQVFWAVEHPRWLCCQEQLAILQHSANRADIFKHPRTRREVEENEL